MMDPTILSLVTFLTLGIGVWAGTIAILYVRIMHQAKQKRGEVRNDDVKYFAFSAIVATICAIVIFIWPGLLQIIPSAASFLAIGCIPILWYISDLSIQHWKRIKLDNNQ